MMNKNLKFAFFGTSKEACHVLNDLKAFGFIPALIVTQPDAPVGRKSIITPSEVAMWASKNNVEVLKPTRLSGLELPNDLDFSLVASYGRIISKTILYNPKFGTFNIHPSLLPKHRGPTPIQTSIINDDETGVTIMKLDEHEDHGPIVTQSESILINKKNYEELEEELFKLGSKLFVDVIPKIISGEVQFKEQDHQDATFTKKYSAEDAFINFNFIANKSDGEKLNHSERVIRALNPEPGAWTLFKNINREQRIKILSAKIEDGKLVPVRVIPAGKKEMGWEDFLRGNRIA